MLQSAINTLLTLSYMTTAPENKYFDRKSAHIKPSDLAPWVAAFANAEGGTIVIGISDKTHRVEGINSVGADKINAFLNMAKDYCKPMPQMQEEFLTVVNERGETDLILLLHVEASVDRLIYMKNDSVYLRIGDRTREIKGEDIHRLEYSKGTRHYEDECNLDAKLVDLDEKLLEKYKERIGAAKLHDEQVLQARGFLVDWHGEHHLTHAAVLLFAKNIVRFYPTCRVRFLRYEGETAGTGTRMNLVKDINVELPILRMVEKAQEVVGAQLREFTSLDPATGRFRTVPEYPEFAWQEGLINAITHREYAMSGEYIRVSMYDDRLEIQSPGRLPDIVTVNNIRDTRFSRNMRIARVLTEFGWVRELNEGVKRIYSDMAEFFLDDPEYTEPSGAAVRLTLKNNIKIRKLRRQDRAAETVGDETWQDLDDLEREILAFMASRQQVTRAELEKVTGKATRTIAIRLNDLIGKGIIKRHGSKYDPKQTYMII
jgi:ATP-dependent DNA helicase RecG